MGLQMEENNEKAMSLLKAKKMDSENPMGLETTSLPQYKIHALPSKFLGYPQGTIITYTPITLDELELLNSDEEIEPELAIARLLDAIQCNTLPAEKLYYWDVMYIGVKRKLLAFGDTTGMAYGKCPKCGHWVPKQFKHTDLEFKELQVPALPMRMTINGKELQFKPVTVEGFLSMQSGMGDLGVYASMIQNMPFEEAFEFVKNTYGVDMLKFRFMDNQLDYGLKPFEVKCNNQVQVANPKFDNTQPQGPDNQPTITKLCGTKTEVEVTSPFEVVFPKDAIVGGNDFEVQYG